MGANDRGFDLNDLGYEVANYLTTTGDFYDVTDDPSLAPGPDFEWWTLDWATFTVTYPDGHVETRTLIGPWDDQEEFEHDITDWIENGTP